MQRRRARSVALVLCYGFLSSAPVLADPIVITGGQFASGSFSSSFTFTADGLFLSAGGGSGLLVGVFRCTPCVSTAPIPLSFGGSTLGMVFSGGGFGEFEGVTYERTSLAGNVMFTGPSFSSAVLSPDNLTLTAPFTMTATISNYSRSPIFDPFPPLFTASLIGSGIATARFTAIPDVERGGFMFHAGSITYDFAAPTPEPATLLLMGTGVAAILRRRLRAH